MSRVSSPLASLRPSWLSAAFAAALLVAPALLFAASSTYYVGGTASSASGESVSLVANSAPVLSGFMQANLALSGGLGGQMHADNPIPEPASTAAVAAVCALAVAWTMRARRRSAVSSAA
jgi:hypothetical protein